MSGLVIGIVIVIVIVLLVALFAGRALMSPKVKSIIITAPAVGQQVAVAELQLFNGDKPVDVSKAVATSSAPFLWADNPDYSPIANLNDGKPDTWAGTSYTSKDIQWVRLDFPTPVVADKVVVYNRADCCQNWMKGCVISVVDSAGATYPVGVATDAMVQSFPIAKPATA